jgi:hypothetical protein
VTRSLPFLFVVVRLFVSFDEFQIEKKEKKEKMNLLRQCFLIDSSATPPMLFASL